jgi:SAM-dependent methyltransferase
MAFNQPPSHVPDRVAPIRMVLLHAAKWLDRARAMCLSLGLGTLRIYHLRVGIVDAWSSYNRDDEEIASGLDADEREVVARFLKPGDRLLIVGCGTGRDVIPLVRMGFDVVGVDPVPEAAITARRILNREGLAAQILEGYFEDIQVPGLFDVIMFSNLCYSYFPESRRRTAMLRKAGTHLSADGRILVTYLTMRPPFQTRMLACLQFAARLSRSDWRPEAGDHLNPIRSAHGGFAYEHFFASGELEREAADAGLHVIPHAQHPLARPLIVLARTQSGAVSAR